MHDAATPSARAAAEQELVAANIGLVKSATGPYAGPASGNGTLEDLTAAGMIGLLDAVRKWNPDKGTLAVFARPYIAGTIRREVRATEARTQGESYTAWQQRPKVFTAVAKLRRDGVPLTVERIAAEAGVTTDTVELLTRPAPLSLSTPLAGHDGAERTVGDLLSDGPPDGRGGDSRTEQDLEQFVAAVPQLLDGDLRGRDIVAFVLRYGLTGRPPAPIGDVAFEMGRNRGEAAASVRKVAAALAADTDTDGGADLDLDLSDEDILDLLTSGRPDAAAALLDELSTARVIDLLPDTPLSVAQAYLRRIGPTAAADLLTQLGEDDVCWLLDGDDTLIDEDDGIAVNSQMVLF